MYLDSTESLIREKKSEDKSIKEHRFCGTDGW